MIHQFLSPKANRRNDDYGGSEANRMRFAIEIVEAVRANWPDNKPLFVRLSVEDGAGWGPEQSVALTRLVKPLGVDVVDCSSGGLRGSPVIDAGKITYGYQVPHAEQTGREADIKTMAVGLIIHANHAEEILQAGHADLIAIAREAFYNPNWPMDAAHKLGVEPPSTSCPAPIVTGYRNAKMPRKVTRHRPIMRLTQRGNKPGRTPREPLRIVSIKQQRLFGRCQTASAIGLAQNCVHRQRTLEDFEIIGLRYSILPSPVAKNALLSPESYRRFRHRWRA